MSPCGASSGPAVWVPDWVPNWLGRARYGTQEPSQIWLTRAKNRFPDGPVTPEVAGSSPVAPVLRSLASAAATTAADCHRLPAPTPECVRILRRPENDDVVGQDLGRESPAHVHLHLPLQVLPVAWV